MIGINKDFRRLLFSLARDEKGATAIEYAIIASGVALAIVATVRKIGPSLLATFDSVKAGF